MALLLTLESTLWPSLLLIPQRLEDRPSVLCRPRDVEVVRNILNDLPMSHAFDPGQTQLFSGLEEAIGICRPWAKDSTSLVILSDGDTLPAIGMPSLPPSVSDVLVVGVCWGFVEIFLLQTLCACQYDKRTSKQSR